MSTIRPRALTPLGSKRFAAAGMDGWGRFWGPFKHQWCRPIMAQLLHPWVARLALLLAAVLVVGQHHGRSMWACPLQTVLQVPCPGCGLTRALLALLKGQWQVAWNGHPFVFVAAGAMLWMFLAAVLPTAWNLHMRQRVAAVERKTGVAAWVLSGLFVWWLFRLGG